MVNNLSPRRVGKIGSSMVAGLFNQSPYVTRTGLYAHFVAGMDVDSKPDKRMGWGRRLQPAILDGVRELLNFEVEANEGDEWRDHPDPDLRCGATIDGAVHDPAVGDGIVEAKNVDRMIWLQDWEEDAAPAHIELQLQHQLFVTGAPFGIIAALVGGNDLVTIRRQPIPSVHARIERELRSFWDQVERREPPDVLGMPQEIPELAALYPFVVPDPILQLFDDAAAADFIEALTEYQAGVEGRKTWTDIEERAKARILGTMRGYGVARTNGFRVDVTKVPVAATVVHLPAEVRNGLAGLIGRLAGKVPPEDEEALREVVADAVTWEHIARRASVQQRIKIKPVGGDQPAPDRLALAASAAADQMGA